MTVNFQIQNPTKVFLEIHKRIIPKDKKKDLRAMCNKMINVVHKIMKKENQPNQKRKKKFLQMISKRFFRNKVQRRDSRFCSVSKTYQVF